jgi:hypothetical protein
MDNVLLATGQAETIDWDFCGKPFSFREIRIAVRG